MRGRFGGSCPLSPWGVRFRTAGRQAQPGLLGRLMAQISALHKTNMGAPEPALSVAEGSTGFADLGGKLAPPLQSAIDPITDPCRFPPDRQRAHHRQRTQRPQIGNEKSAYRE